MQNIGPDQAGIEQIFSHPAPLAFGHLDTENAEKILATDGRGFTRINRESKKEERRKGFYPC